MARHIVRNLNSYLSATQLGITMASLGLGYLGEPVFTTLLEPLLVPLGVKSGDLAAFHFLRRRFQRADLSEHHGRRTGAEMADDSKAVAGRAVGGVSVALVLPGVLSVQLAAELRGALAFGRLGIEPDGAARPRAVGGGIASAWSRRPQATAGGRNIILNALDLRHRIAREVMRPRHEITAFDTDATLAECLALAEKTRYSRFPLCEGGDLDKTRGVVHIKDLYAAARPRRGRRRICCRWRAR